MNVMRIITAITAILWLSSLLLSCKHDETEPVTIHRFEVETFGIADKSEAEKQRLANKYKEVINLYVDKIYPDSQMTGTAKLETFTNSNAINFFYEATVSKFADIADIEKQLGKEKKSISQFGIEFPEIYSAIIPYNQSIILNDSVAIIGLNHYLGADYEPYGYFPEYKRHFKIKEKIKYDLAEAILKTRFEYAPKTNTLLERMVYEGMIAAAAEKVVPEYADSLYFSITKEKFEWSVAHERQIWEQLLIEDVLYSTSGFLQSALLEPAPFSEYLSRESPGQVCRWIGKRIMEKYIANNGGDIKELLSTKRYQQSQNLLIDSGYDGKQ